MSEMNNGESRCEKCQKSFSTADALSMHRKVKHPETKPVEKDYNPVFTKWKIPIIVVLVLSIGVAVLASGVLQSNTLKTSLNIEGMQFPTGNVHWHANLDASVCGEPYLMPNAPIVDHLLHTHEDGLIHVEGAAATPEQITLGKFVQRLGTAFNANEFNGKKIGDNCPNGEKITQMVFLVNGNENTEFENRVIRDGETYTIRLESAEGPA
jgi:hypothetical protein